MSFPKSLYGKTPVVPSLRSKVHIQIFYVDHYNQNSNY